MSVNGVAADIVRATCIEADGSETVVERGLLRIRFAMLFLNHAKKASLKNLAQTDVADIVASGNKVRLDFNLTDAPENIRSCEVEFKDEVSAGKVKKEIGDNIKRNRGTPQSSKQASTVSPQKRESRKHSYMGDDLLGGNTLAKIGNAPVDRFSDHAAGGSSASSSAAHSTFQRDRLGEVQTPPPHAECRQLADGTEVRNKRKWELNCNVVDGDGRTPEKASRGASFYGRSSFGPGPVRERTTANTAIALGPRVSVARNVTSAAYGSYRSAHRFGLQNLGNTCYLNAVVQALCSLREFITDLKRMPETIPQVASGVLFKNSTEIFSRMGNATPASGPFSPAKLRELISQASPMFAGNRQQDAHEFLLDFINQMHDELLSARKDWLEATFQIDDEAGGILATQSHLDSEVQKTLSCCSCAEQRDVSERFRDFSLDFPAKSSSAVASTGGDRCELRSMLENYFAVENVEVKCSIEKCPATQARMSKHLVTAPRVLVLHLKRFVPNIEKQMYEKQHQHVEIPQRFELRSFLRKAYVDNAGGDTPRTASLPARPLAAESFIWEVELDGQWQCFSHDEARQIEHKYNEAPTDICALEARRQQYVIDFSTMSQLNLETSTRRPVRRRQPCSSEGFSDDVAGGCWYELRSVIAHEGASPHSGHYVCYARSETGRWRLYNDSFVTEINEDPLRGLGRKAYILFYVLQQ